MEVPVIIIHRGYSSYLKWALLQAKLQNKKVILLGDSSNEHLKDFVEFYRIENFQSPLLKDFAAAYVHMSTNDRKFEFTCFERWFVLLEFMTQENFETTLHLDSDVMLFDNMSEVLDSFQESTLAAYHIPEQTYEEKRWVAIPHTSLWTKNGIKQFCEFMLSSYQHNLQELKDKWKWHLDTTKRGGISDMALLYLFFVKHGQVIINLARPRIDYSGKPYTFDLNINTSENFDRNEFSMGRSSFFFNTKRLKADHGRFKGYSIVRNDYITFASLHCQGKAKILMFLFYQGTKKLKDKIEFMGFALSFIRKRTSTFIDYQFKKFFRYFHHD